MSAPTSDLPAGALPLRLNETPFAVVDVETTGVHAHADRLVEIAVHRFDPRTGHSERFDSLIDPQRPMGAQFIHGINDGHVLGAPTFEDIHQEVQRLTAGAVLAAYNVSFDARFIRSEFARLRIEFEPPQVCLMLMRPLLGLGGRCSLSDLCDAIGIEHAADAHTADSDCSAECELLSRYLGVCRRRGVDTFGDLSELGDYAFLQTLGRPLPPQVVSPPAGACQRG